MSLLIDISPAFCTEILSLWCDLKVVGNVDSSFTNTTSRNCFLRLLNYKCAVFECVRLSTKTHHVLQNWLVLRGIKFRTLSIDLEDCVVEFENLGMSLERVTKIEFKNCSKDSLFENSLCTLINGCAKLTSLTIRNVESFTDVASHKIDFIILNQLKDIGIRCNLFGKQISYTEDKRLCYRNVTNDMLSRFSYTCPSLTSLSLYQPKTKANLISEAVLINLIKQNPELNHVSLWGFNLSSVLIETLVKYHQNLRELYLEEGEFRFNYNDFIRLCTTFPSIESVYILDDNDDSTVAFEYVKHASRDTKGEGYGEIKFHSHNNNVNNDYDADVDIPRFLEQIKLISIKKVTAEKLECADLDIVCEAIARHYPLLEEFEVCGMSSYKGEGLQCIQGIEQLFLNCPHLHKLSITATFDEIGAEQFITLLSVKNNLTELSLSTITARDVIQILEMNKHIEKIDPSYIVYRDKEEENMVKIKQYVASVQSERKLEISGFFARKYAANNSYENAVISVESI